MNMGEDLKKEVLTWQNVLFAEKALILEMQAVTHIEDQTKCGNEILNA